MSDKKDPLFGKIERKLLSDPLNSNNPVTVQVLGICSALAVTTLVSKAFIMAIAVVFVTAFSNLIISVLRNKIPSSIRMIVQLVVVAFMVTIVELTLKAVNYPIYKDLAVYIGLIITNCIVMGRLEAYAMANKPWRSFVDGVGNGAGYGAILLIIAFVREIGGKGSLFAGTPIQMLFIGKGADYMINTETSEWFGWYSNNGLLVIPASAMFIIAIVIWIQRTYNSKLVDIS